jgi:hypothetical protein
MCTNPAGGLEHPRGQAFKGQLDVLSLSNLMGQDENTSSLTSISWGDILDSSRSSLGSSTRGTAFVEPSSADQLVHDYGNYPSSSSLSEVFSSKCEFLLHFQFVLLDIGELVPSLVGSVIDLANLLFSLP